MIIYGWRRQVRHLTNVTYLCGQCQNPTAHALRKTVTKFTLFFIPLFPVNSKHFTVCTFCGATNKLTKAEAQQVLATQEGAAPQAPQPSQNRPPQPMPQAQPPTAGGRQQPPYSQN